MIEYDTMEKKLYQNLWKSVADDIMKEYQFKTLDIPTAVESAEGDKDCVIFLLESFRDNQEKNKNDIVGSYTKEDYPNYTIFVHALKSTAKMIGALELSDMAKKMEQAGKEGDIDYIKENYDAMIEEFDKVVEEIKDYLNKD
jgi:HPt (histidine-containing phosphotransfer) domain-containing protein